MRKCFMKILKYSPYVPEHKSNRTRICALTWHRAPRTISPSIFVRMRCVKDDWYVEVFYGLENDDWKLTWSQYTMNGQTDEPWQNGSLCMADTFHGKGEKAFFPGADSIEIRLIFWEICSWGR